MQYRRFPKIDGLEVSTLGLGCMRLPQRSADPADIDEAALDAMVLAAREAGVNYLDTAYIYHKGRSEAALGESLERTGSRGDFLLATKSPVWLAKDSGDWERFLDEQLKRLKTDHVDFYLLHALSAERWALVEKLGGLRAMERFRMDGRIRHLGFSFHDNLDAFKRIVDGYPAWEFCQVQYNYVDKDFQAGEAGLRYAAEREIGAIVMEPLRGGALVRAPRAVREIFARHPKPRMLAEWAMRFVWERQEVTTALSGMGSVDQVLENAAYAEAARMNSLTRAEMALFDEARAFFKEREKVPCTGCGYCRPCPSGVSIPDCFELYNAAAMFDIKADRGRWYEAAYRSQGKGGNACVQCGACVPKCPQGIAIPERLAEADGYLKGGA
ncbi:MAG TPA: aldo/keto reductase [Spirochaetales bacterium]|nr:aldo/keto reductase [Spirochaetales bacterium]